MLLEDQYGIRLTSQVVAWSRRVLSAFQWPDPFLTSANVQVLLFARLARYMAGRWEIPPARHGGL